MAAHWSLAIPARDRPRPGPGRRVVMDEPTKKATAKALEWLADQAERRRLLERRPLPAQHRHHRRSRCWRSCRRATCPTRASTARRWPRARASCSPAPRERRLPRRHPRRQHVLPRHGDLALAELWGMTGDEEVKRSLEEGRRPDRQDARTARAAGATTRTPTGADISVTIMQVMALRGREEQRPARAGQDDEEGHRVHQQLLRPASRRLHLPAVAAAGPGFARTAAGVCVLQLCRRVRRRARSRRRSSTWSDNFDTREHFWYGHYYAAHAMHQVGGKEWEEWYGRMSDDSCRCRPPTAVGRGRRTASGSGPVYRRRSR